MPRKMASVVWVFKEMRLDNWKIVFDHVDTQSWSKPLTLGWCPNRFWILLVYKVGLVASRASVLLLSRQEDAAVKAADTTGLLSLISPPCLPWYTFCSNSRLRHHKKVIWSQILLLSRESPLPPRCCCCCCFHLFGECAVKQGRSWETSLLLHGPFVYTG